MPALRSCYFCGEAVGASVDEHAVPADAPAAEQVSVTLCSSCKGKLEQLVAHMRGAPAGGSESDRSSDGKRSSGETSDGAGAAGEAEREASQAASLSRDVASEVADAASGSPDAASGGTDAAGDASGGTPDGSGETPDGSADAPAADPTPGDQDPIFANDDGTLLGGDDEEAAAGEQSRDASAGAETGRAAGARGASAANDGDVGADADDPLAGVSTRTYNRVVRLLQNREFPVDRAEFETLATNAYEMEPGECDGALDAIVEKGLLEERGGKLHRPD